MALIKCSECGREMSDKAANCLGCGNPISTHNSDKMNEEEVYLGCPKCKSRNLHIEKKGFSGGKAFAGAVLTGGIGLLAGTIGSDDILITCLSCNHRFRASNALKLLSDSKFKELEGWIIKVLKIHGRSRAIMVYKRHTRSNLQNTIDFVDSTIKKFNINFDQKEEDELVKEVRILLSQGHTDEAIELYTNQTGLSFDEVCLELHNIKKELPEYKKLKSAEKFTIMPFIRAIILLLIVVGIFSFLVAVMSWIFG